MYVEFTPVDICARAIITIMQNYVPDFSVFHLYDDSHVYMNSFLQAFKDSKLDVKVISEKEFSNKIIKMLKNNSNDSIISGIINDIGPDNKIEYKSNIHITSDFTKAFLYHLKFVWPEIDKEYLKKYINFIKNIKP